MDISENEWEMVWSLANKAISNKHKRRLFALLTFAARKNLLLSWISDKPPSMKGWHSVIGETIPLELLTCFIHSTTDTFTRTWSPYLDNINASICDILRFGII